MTYPKMRSTTLILLPLLLLVTLASAAINTTITYDFNSCTNLTNCNLSEVGYNAGLNQSYITSFGGSNVLYYNGLRHSSSPYENYALQFNNVPTNTTILEFSVFPIDNSYSEFYFMFRTNDTRIQGYGVPYTSIYYMNTDYADRHDITADFDGTAYNSSGIKVYHGSWTKVTIIFNYTDQTLKSYYNDTFQQMLDLSSIMNNSVNLGELALLASASSDTPNIYIDNVTFTNETPSNVTPNNPPSIDSRTPISNPTIAKKNTQNFTINASDADNDTLSYQWLVTGIDQNNNKTYFEFTKNTSGTYNIQAIVSDGEDTDSTSWNITFTNAAPVMQESNITTQGSTLIGYCNATDANNDEVFYSYEWYNNDTKISSNYETHTEYCYQETANQTSGCGGLATGNYDWGYLDYIYFAIGGTSTYYFNYTKPNNALSGEWLVQHSSLSPYNITIPSNCWNAYPNTLVLAIDTTLDAVFRSQPLCHNGVGWQAIGNFSQAGTSRGITYGTATPTEVFDGNWATNVCGWGVSQPQFNINCPSSAGAAKVYEEAMYWELLKTNSHPQGIRINIDNETIVGGNYTLSCQALDTEGATSNWLNSTEIGVNTPPTIDGIDPSSPFSMIESQAHDFVVTASDADNDSLTYVWYVNASLQAETTTTFTFVGNVHGVGTYNLSVTVTDGEDSVEASWLITVTPNYVPAYGAGDADDVVIDTLVEGLIILQWFAAGFVVIALALFMSCKWRMIKK